MKAIDFCNKVFDGTHDTPKPVSNGKLLITSKHIANRCLDTTSAYYISEDDYNTINKRSRIQQYDILFSMIGTVGNVYIERSENVDYAIKNMGVFSCGDRDKALWLYYYLQSPKMKMIINSYLSGAVQKFVPLDFLRNLDIPEYTSKCKSIVTVLTALDDKIALNKRINDKLEAMAKRLYDYWFVQFDFPDENGRPYKSSGGKMVWNETLKREIPEGWEVKRLGDICCTVLGGTPSTSIDDYWNGDIPWLNSGEVAEFPIIKSEKKITQNAIDNSATELVPKGSVTLSITRHLRTSILAIDACINQSVVAIKENEPLKHSYIYPYITNEIPRLMDLRTGAQQPHINKDIVDSCNIVIPNIRVLMNYQKQSSVYYKDIILRRFETDRLSALRDRLLPLLMNGQVIVDGEV